MIAFFLALALCLVPLTASAGDLLFGDANDDGAINLKDVLTERRYLASLSTKISLTLGDCNGDGAVNMKDVLILRQYLAEIIDKIEGKEPAYTQKRLRSVFHYDGDGNNFEINFYTYNDSGDLTLVNDRLEDRTLIWRKDYTFDDKHREIRCVHTEDDVKGLITETSYDDKGRISMVEKTDSQGKTICTTTFAYNADGKLVKESYFDAAGKADGKTVYTYDSKSRLAKEETFGADGSSFGYATFAYNSKGDTSAIKRYNAAGEFIGDEQFTYDEKGNLKSHVYNDEKGLLDARIDYAYDTTYTLKWEFGYNFSQGNERWKYVYTQKYPIRSATCYNWDGKTVLWKDTYQYVDA